MAFGKKSAPTPDETNKAMLDALTGLGESFKEGFEKMNQGLTTLSNQVNQQTTTLKPAEKPEKDDDPAPHGDVEVEDLTNQQMLDRVDATMEKALGKVTDLFATRDKNTSETAIRTRFDELSKDDLFVALKGEMAVLAKDDPTLTNNLDNLFAIAKHQNADKVTEFNKVQAEKTEESENEKKDDTPAFGGFTPTSGKSPVDEEGKRMTSSEAAEDAWEKVMSDVPDSIIGGNA